MPASPMNDIHDKTISRIAEANGDPAKIAEAVEDWLNYARIHPVDDPLTCMAEIVEAANGKTE